MPKSRKASPADDRPDHRDAGESQNQVTPALPVHPGQLPACSSTSPRTAPTRSVRSTRPSFQEAGPRERIYFDPPKTKCAIVTSGGLCPGINDVIRAIVMEAQHRYGVHTTLGIRYGLEGFIPAYGHEVMELTPESVSSIHEFGGTILGSSRGPQSPDRHRRFPRAAEHLHSLPDRGRRNDACRPEGPRGGHSSGD
jgi:hypothetical protein